MDKNGDNTSPPHLPPDWTLSICRSNSTCGYSSDRSIPHATLKKLHEVVFQARETGICPIRRELYSQCFDELIRQITVNCGERGLLLLRIRDEMRMTMEAYQALYCSSIAFGMRKALQAEQGKSDLQTDIDRLGEEKVDVERQLVDLRQRSEQNERRAEELRIAEEKKHNEEIVFLKKTNLQLKVSLG